MTRLSRHACQAAFIVGLWFVASAASAQQGGGLFGGVFGNDDSRQQQQGGAPDDSDMAVRLDQLQGQMRQLTGQMEQLQYRNQQLEAQVKRMQEDAEYRFQQLGSKGGVPAGSAPRSSVQPPPPVQNPVAQPEPGRRSDAFDPSQHPSAPGAPRALGSLNSQEPPPIVRAEPSAAPIGAPGGRQSTGEPLELSTLSNASAPGAQSAGAGPLLPPPPARNPNATGAVASVAPPSGSAKDEYDLAYGYVLHKDYALAENGFRAFLRDHPNDRQADAHYWLGESLFQRQRYRDAAENFLAVSTKHSTSSKAPEALLRLGQSLAALGEKDAACGTLAEVGRKYPRASLSVRKGVEREQKRAHCTG